MPKTKNNYMPKIDLNQTDQDILDKLKEGRNIPSNIAKDIGKSREYISRRIKRLEEHGYLENIGSGVYELKEDPRNN